MQPRANLDSAYRAAHYIVVVPRGPRRVVIGHADPALDAALRRSGCRSHWCLLTPCNPRSRRLSAVQNAQRLRLLQRLVRRIGWRALRAHNASTDGRWIEPGVCLLDARPHLVDRLARRFGQLAWVFGPLGAAPQLVWTDYPRRSI